MFNNKKSFLQKARIAMVAIVTIMSIGGAYAVNGPKAQLGTTWGVVVTNANSYQVTAVTANSQCNNPTTTPVCEIRSSTAPDENNDIPKADATIVKHGDFVQ